MKELQHRFHRNHNSSSSISFFVGEEYLWKIFKRTVLNFKIKTFFYHTKNIPCFLKPMKRLDRKMAEKTCTAVTESIRSILRRCFSMGFTKWSRANSDKSGSD